MDGVAQFAGIMRLRLIRWRGDPVLTDNPEGHPDCLEIVEQDDEGNRTVIFKRATDE